MLSSINEGSWVTHEERALLAASARGLGTAEVAELLDRPPEYVRRSIASASAKLGARSKLEAVIIALKTGLIDLPARTARWGGDVHQIAYQRCRGFLNAP